MTRTLRRWFEEACVRCPMPGVGPRQCRRLEGIISNLKDRVQEARASGRPDQVTD